MTDAPLGEYNLDDWIKALTIHVGAVYACRCCQNLVMVTKGGVGVLELNCCDKPMERLNPCSNTPDEGADHAR